MDSSVGVGAGIGVQLHAGGVKDLPFARRLELPPVQQLLAGVRLVDDAFSCIWDVDHGTVLARDAAVSVRTGRALLLARLAAGQLLLSRGRRPPVGPCEGVARTCGGETGVSPSPTCPTCHDEPAVGTPVDLLFLEQWMNQQWELLLIY